MAFGSSPIVLALDAFPLSFFPSLVVYLARVFRFIMMVLLFVYTLYS